MSWQMTYCADSGSALLKKEFKTFEDGIAWLEQNAPILLAPETWKSLDDDRWRQYGTNYHWAGFTRRI